jgi:alpha-L-fucosidase
MKNQKKRTLRMLAVAVVAISPLAALHCQADDAALAAQLKIIDQTIAKGPFQPEWDSLKAHQDPEWFRDAKFGIYTHWGPVTVGAEDGPSGGQWYGHSMYDTNSPTFKYHQKKYGDQHTVGYKDMVPKFTADKFNAEDWADLFAKAGAKFAGPVAVHHDNFTMWDSQLTRWNSVGMGPHRDITGELEKAIRAHGLKFITTFHHGFAWRYFEPAFKFDAADGKNTDLYTEVHAPKAPPSKHFQDMWLAMVDEVLNKYQPDLIWFDFEFFAVIQPEYQQKLFATAYDWAAQNNRTIGVCQKSRDIHKYTSILDFERGREDKLVPYPWLTDSAAGEWFHQRSAPYKSVHALVTTLADIVSKNGCLLLDVGPAADGTIPPTARERLLGVGDWLRVNGEAIYGTRPWKIYGEGPTKQAKAGGFSENADKPFTAQDIRFTTKGDALYAITLAVPQGEVKINSLGLAAGKIDSISLLGSDAKLDWKQDADALTIQPVAKWPCQHAVAFKISFAK